MPWSSGGDGASRPLSFSSSCWLSSQGRGPRPRPRAPRALRPPVPTRTVMGWVGHAIGATGAAARRAWPFKCLRTRTWLSPATTGIATGGIGRSVGPARGSRFPRTPTSVHEGAVGNAIADSGEPASRVWPSRCPSMRTSRMPATPGSVSEASAGWAMAARRSRSRRTGTWHGRAMNGNAIGATRGRTGRASRWTSLPTGI
jgi:hypothetical protein